MPLTFKTQGEAVFAELLDSRNLSYEYEKSYPSKNNVPDFTLDFVTPNVIAEVRDVDLNPEDEDIVARLSAVHTASWVQDKPYHRLRRMIHEKADQLKDYTEFPILIVLYKNSQNLTVDLSSRSIFESMFGDHVVTVHTEPTGKVVTESTFDIKNAALGLNRNKHISAIAVVENFQPHKDLASRITKKHFKDGGNAMTEKGQEELTALFDAERKKGIDFDLNVLRLRIVHNVFANKPLEMGIMASIYDEEMFYDKNLQKARMHRNGVVTDYQ